MQTVTPADVPTDEPTPTPVPQLAPGLTRGRVVDGFALVNAHGAALNNTSYTVRRNSTTMFRNGTLFDQSTTRTQLAANEGQFYQIENSSAIPIRGLGTLSERIYSTGERTLVARTENDSTSYAVPQSGGEPIPVQYAASGFSRDRIELLFNTVETRVTGRTASNGTTLYRVVGTNVTNPVAFGSATLQNPRNITFQAVVDSQGLIREYQVSYTATKNDSPVRVDRGVRYTDVGNTTIERPAWYEEAIGNVSTATTSTAAT